MIRCIIIDDEQHAIDVIRTYCRRIPYIEVVGEFTDPREAVAFLDAQSHSVDLVFLDIEMPRFSGIDFLKAYTFPNVILVTAYTEYALESYQYGVVDYLLKPVAFERFSTAVKRVHERQQSKITANRRESPSKDSIYVKIDRNKIEKIALQDIVYIQGAKNYAVIQTKTQSIVSSLRLKELEEQLPDERFVRIHKSHIIHMDYLEALEGNNVRLKNINRTLVLGGAYKPDFLRLIEP